jgi:hypothetical protein
VGEVALGVIGEGVNVLDGVTVGVNEGGTNWVGVGWRVLVGPPGVAEGPGVTLGLGVALGWVGVSIIGWVGVFGSVGVTRC